jgi:hypothetical protein
MRIVCPRCASLETCSLSLIHREGLSHSQAIAGVAVGSSGGAGTVSAVSHSRSSVLSKHTAPPRKKNVTGWLLLAGALGMVLLGSIRAFGWSTILLAGSAVFAGYMAKTAHDYNTSAYPSLYSSWQQSFMCSRCGAVFVAE